MYATPMIAPLGEAMGGIQSPQHKTLYLAGDTHASEVDQALEQFKPEIISERNARISGFEFHYMGKTPGKPFGKWNATTII